MWVVTSRLIVSAADSAGTSLRVWPTLCSAPLLLRYVGVDTNIVFTTNSLVHSVIVWALCLVCFARLRRCRSYGYWWKEEVWHPGVFWVASPLSARASSLPLVALHSPSAWRSTGVVLPVMIPIA